jgi:carbon monoxide dehydrogenase subunit G
MLLHVDKAVVLRTAPDAVWAIVREPERVAACLPNAQDFQPTGEPGQYSTTLVEHLGPFSVRIGLAVEVTEDATNRVMVARIAGEDRGGQARVRGDVRASVRAEVDGTALAVTSDVEVLGRLAALGAVPIRRRGDQVFDQFIAALTVLLEGPS